jgi:non-heme chloroperoxidase
MPTVEVGGVRLFWAEQGTGPTLLFVHGIPTDYRAWEAPTTALSDRYRAISYSRRYAFPNERTGDVLDSTVENNAADLAGLIGTLGLAPVHLVGHSYGGFVAAYLATRQATLLRSLTLVEPAIASLLLRDPKSRSEALGLLFRHPRAALSAQRFLKTSNDPALAALRRGDLPTAVRLGVDGVEDRTGALDQLAEPVRKMMLDNARTVWETSLPYPPVSRSELAQLRMPTLILHGQTSVLWLRAVAAMAGAAIPGSEVVPIPHAGHFPHIQNPAAFNGALRRFLERVDSSR